MKVFKTLLFMIGLMSLGACTNWNYIDTGVHNPNEYVETSAFGYLKKNANQFYLTTALIERAGLTNLFEGKDPQHPKIMFIAPTKYAIMAGMMRMNYAQTPLKDSKGNSVDIDYLKDIQNIPVEICRSIILSYTFDKAYLRDEFPLGHRGEGVDLMQQGEIMTSLNGNKIWFYRQQTSFGNFSDVHVNTIIGIEVDTKTDLYLTSTDLKVKNGVVHANVDGFIIKDLKP